MRTPGLGHRRRRKGGYPWVTRQGLLMNAGFLGAVLSLTFPGGFWPLSPEGRIHKSEFLNHLW